MATQGCRMCIWSSHTASYSGVDGQVCECIVWLCVVFLTNKYTTVGINEPLLLICCKLYLGLQDYSRNCCPKELYPLSLSSTFK